MRKKVTIIAIGLIFLVALGGLAVWRLMGQPLYEPGMVRSGKNLRSPLAPPEQTSGEPYWLVEGDIRLFYHTKGAGRPVLVIHGGPGFPIRQPLRALEPLTGQYTFYYYDQRGCGRSTKPFDRFASGNFYANMKVLDRTLGIGAQVADIERIRRILGQEKLILLGHSFGAFLASLYAAEFPEHVTALVLVTPSGVLVLPDEEGGFFEDIRQHLPEEQRADYEHFMTEYLDFGQVFSKSEEDLARSNRRVGEFFLAASGDQLARGANESPDNGGWMVQAMYLSMGKRHDYRAALRAVQAPVLLVHGENDLVPVRVSRMYVDCFPNARLHVVKNSKTAAGGCAGHFLLSDQSDGLAAVVGEFLAEGDGQR
jgi:proline iminopeptidase